MKTEIHDSWSDKMKKKKKKKKKKRINTSKRVSRGLFRRSFTDKLKDNNSKKFSSIDKPLVATLSKTTTTTTSITIITPPEDPNDHINLYLCIQGPGSPPHDIGFQWFKIDPTNTEVEVEMEEEDEVETEEEDPKSKPKSESKPIFLTPISSMPTMTPWNFRAIPHSSKQKLVYAIGDLANGTNWESSQKAFVCNFSANPPVWEELPPTPQPMRVFFGVASPLDGNVYTFGRFDNGREFSLYSHSYTGLVFEPASKSWRPCPHPFRNRIYNSVTDYALVRTRDRNQFIVFGDGDSKHLVFDLTTANWGSSFYAPIRSKTFRTSSSVAVGDIIYRFNNPKLYALDLTCQTPQFKRVYGLEKEVPTTYGTVGLGYLAYLGKGKLCILWGGRDWSVKEADIVRITCLKFWVGVCSKSNQLLAVVDRCDHYAAHGYELHDFVAF